MDGFQNCFPLIIDWSFVIVFNFKKCTYPPEQGNKLTLAKGGVVDPDVAYAELINGRDG